MRRCVAPRCAIDRVDGQAFCADHMLAPRGRRGGWLSAHRRMVKMSGVILGPDASTASYDGERLNADCVAKRLWVGAQPRFLLERDLPDFDVIVLCAQELQPSDCKLPFHGRVIKCPIDDNPRDGMQTRELRSVLIAGRDVARELVAGKTVLVTCAMGWNRSALVAGLGLGLCTRLSAKEIVDAIRARRDPHCLSNPHFVRVLERFIGAGRRAPIAQLGPAAE